MLWLVVSILAYFFLAIVALFDRYFLVGPLPSSRVYTFNVVILWFFLGILLVPFGISLPVLGILFLGLAAGLVRAIAILFLTEGIIRSEVSRIVPANGALLPIFSFLLFFVFLRTDFLNFSQVLAFILLLLGSVLISFKKLNKDFFDFKTFKYPIISAFLFAANFFLLKYLFLKTDFINGLFLILIGGGIGGLLFLLFPKTRKEIINQKPNKKISGFFLLGQCFGGLGVISQYYAVFLATPNQVPLINAIEGIRYVFLLFFIFLLSRWRPQLLKEEISGSTLIQKIIAILIIGAGLIILSLKL